MTLAAENQEAPPVPATREGLTALGNEVIEREREEAESAPAPVEREAPPPLAPDKDSLSLQEWRDAKRKQSEALKAFEQSPGDAQSVEAPANEPPAETPAAHEETADSALERQAIEAFLTKIENGETISGEDAEGTLKALGALQDRRAEIQATGYQLAANASLGGANVQVKAAANQLMAMDSLLTNAFVQKFPEIRSQADLARMAAESPERATAAMQFLGQAKTIFENEIAGLQAQQSAWAENYNAWGQTQDAEFERRLEKDFPQVKGEQRGKVAEAAIAMLNREGVSNENIAALQNGVANIPWRHSAVQTILMKAALYDQAQTSKLNALKQPLPQVVRPGVAGRHSSFDQEIRAADKAFSKNPSLRNAVRLRVAKDRAAGA